jgi:DNA-binding NarL/FixJ family response regulator
MEILIVDNHEVFRLGLRAALSTVEGLQVVGEAATAREALVWMDKKRPDLVIMDMALPGMDGAVATREIKRRSPEVRVLILSVHEQVVDVLDALNAGASGFALKSEGLAGLLESIKAVGGGGQYISPRLVVPVAELRNRSSFSDPLCLLSEREREVFRLAAAGLSNRDIARELCVSLKTVETHRYRINKKLGLRSGAQLVRFAARFGLLAVEPRQMPSPTSGDMLMAVGTESLGEGH